MTTNNTYRPYFIAATVAYGIALIAGTYYGLSPFVTTILGDLNMGNAAAQGAAIALIILFASAASKVAKVDSRVITTALVLSSVAILGGRYVATKHVIQSKYDARRMAEIARLDACVTKAREDGKQRKKAYKGVYITKTEERIDVEVAADVKRCNDTIVVAAAKEITLGADHYVSIAGLAIFDLAVALLIKLLGGTFGSALVFLLGQLTGATIAAAERKQKRRDAAKKGWARRRQKAAEVKKEAAVASGKVVSMEHRKGGRYGVVLGEGGERV